MRRTSGQFASRRLLDPPARIVIDLAKIDAYERKGQNRTTVLSRIASLQRAQRETATA